MSQLYEDDMDHFKERRTLIKDHSKHILSVADSFGDDVLKGRRNLGIPDPEDAKAFGSSLLKFQIGLRALAVGMQEPNFRISGVPDSLRLWLTNPMTDIPATDEDLSMYIEMLTEHEQRTEA